MYYYLIIYHVGLDLGSDYFIIQKKILIVLALMSKLYKEYRVTVLALLSKILEFGRIA